MGGDSGSSRKTQELVEELRRRVDERRRAGAYPVGLEEDLDSHFRRIVAQRTGDVEMAKAAVARVQSTMAFNRARIPFQSDVPAGAFAHRAVGKLVSRQTQGVLEQVQDFANAVLDALTAMLGVLEVPGTHEHADLTSQLDALLERVTDLLRVQPGPEAVVAELLDRVARLEAANARHRFEPWFGNARFEEAFRGAPDELRSHYRDLAEQFVGCGPVLDIGCGRGEFLELLAEKDIEGIGVELDPELVALATGQGLRVESGDGLERLAAAGDGSLGGIVLIQVIEHLTAQEVLDLVAMAHAKLREGGRIVVETVNPQSLYVFAHSLYVDPTHARPVHPAYLDFLFREAGFPHVEIHWRALPDERLEAPGPEAGEAVAANVRRLNDLVYGPQDYAILALR
jgi:SAM-dependent methyltransferase